ncbi:MAG: alkaline phosphatase family protein [Verrucomicrobiales bacterium]|nr:alkaline phosphatase family protein [Verrucomicrobiales bacterium]
MKNSSSSFRWSAQISLLFTLCAIWGGVEKAEARGKAEHVVVVVWDGLRPDFITPQYTPTLYELATKGTFFKNNHSAYITSTEVNGTALATGMHPDHSGVMANFEYRPDLHWLSAYGTENLDAVRRGDLLTQGNYLGAATVAEILQREGFPTVVAGTKPIALLHDRAPKKSSQAEKDSVTLFRGQTLPRSVLESLTRSPDIGPFPTNLAAFGFGSRERSSTNAAALAAEAAALNPDPANPSRRSQSTLNTPDSWTTKALTRGLWRKGVPKYTLLWLSEPDASQHAAGIGSDTAIAALESSDKNLALVLKTLEEKGVLDSTDIFVVSDHGFSTINRGPDIIESLKKSKFVAGKQFQNPEPGDIMVINLGGSTSFYVFDHDESVIRRLVAYLQATDFAGVIFSALPIEGTFSLAQVHVRTTNTAPDVVVSMRWTAEKNEHGAPGMVTSIEGRRGLGTHASLSRFDLHNTLIAAGPDFKKGYLSELPSGNIDVAPTVLSILGVEPPRPMDGRVLYEAMTSGDPPPLKPVEHTLKAQRDLGFLIWHQYLKIIQVGYAIYYDEGNGECRFK